MKEKVTVEITLGEADAIMAALREAQDIIGQAEYDAIKQKICFAIADCMKEVDSYFIFICVIGVDDKRYLDRGGNPCYYPDLMGMETARSVYDKALKKFPPEVELCLCLGTKHGDPILLERRCGEADGYNIR